MRVKFKDLLLWQWKPTMVRYWDEELRYNWQDECDIRDLMISIKKVGLKEPIRINHGQNEWLSDKAQKQLKSGKWFVENGFHRIYAMRRLGYKTIEARVY